MYDNYGFGLFSINDFWSADWRFEFLVEQSLSLFSFVFVLEFIFYLIVGVYAVHGYFVSNIRDTRCVATRYGSGG